MLDQYCLKSQTNTSDTSSDLDNQKFIDGQQMFMYERQQIKNEELASQKEELEASHQKEVQLGGGSQDGGESESDQD